MTIEPVIPLSLSSALEQFAQQWENLATEGMSEGVFGSLNFTEAVGIADVLHAGGYPNTAGEVMREWAANDEDWEEYAEDIHAWLLLLGDTRATKILAELRQRQEGPTPFDTEST